VAKDKYKYEWIYNGEGSFTNGKNEMDEEIRKKYGHGGNGKRFTNIILEQVKPTSILDVGCGHNEFVKDMRNIRREIKSIGVDFACPGADIMANAEDLPFKDKEWDLLTSFDMLEHVPEDEVDLVIEEFRRVSDRFFYNISLKRERKRVNGKNLHPTVKPSEWWIDKIEKSGEISFVMNLYNRAICKKNIAKKLIVGGFFK